MDQRRLVFYVFLLDVCWCTVQIVPNITLLGLFGTRWPTLALDLLVFIVHLLLITLLHVVRRRYPGLDTATSAVIERLVQTV